MYRQGVAGRNPNVVRNVENRQDDQFEDWLDRIAPQPGVDAPPPVVHGRQVRQPGMYLALVGTFALAGIGTHMALAIMTPALQQANVPDQVLQAAHRLLFISNAIATVGLVAVTACFNCREPQEG